MYTDVYIIYGIIEHQKNLEINFLANFVYVDTKHGCSGLPVVLI